MTAWDMVSIAIVDLTGGFVAGLLFPVWLAKHEVFLFLLKLGFGGLLVLWLLMTAFGAGS